MKKQQEYLVTLINLHIYNQPFIAGISNQDVNNISFIIIFIYTLIKKKVKRMYSFANLLVKHQAYNYKMDIKQE